ncbi:hypothetical protein WMY93_015237 [Mugilogobius chulae]|uniref:Beta/gamma crystallin 'Greek key' domain-containing protein n=1 Tax=Mugilogobius chulae TaxID=88201 RepID=A0AAW0NWN2_9GOBI
MSELEGEREEAEKEKDAKKGTREIEERRKSQEGEMGGRGNREKRRGRSAKRCVSEKNTAASSFSSTLNDLADNRWVLYEEINYRGAQILLRPGEVADWRSFSGWRKVGSLRPLLQKQEMEESQGFEQIWFYQNGHLRCKLLEECCLCTSSSVTIAGARLGLTPALDDRTHLWSITPEESSATAPPPPGAGGGHHYDKNQVVLSTRDPHKAQQQWSIEVL